MSDQATPALNPSQLAGHTFGRYTVLRLAGKSADHHRYWRCRCECGTEQDVRGTKLLTGRATQCGPCNKAEARRAGKYRRRLPPGVAACNALIAEYQANARVKGVEFDLSDDEMRRLFSMPCHYCGLLPAAVRKRRHGDTFVYSGIDRQDCGGGYVVGNVAPCCSTCNYAKRKMTAIEFLAWVERAYLHQRGIK